MPRTRRASRKQRGGFLESLFGNLFGKPKNGNTASNGQEAAPVSANTTYTNPAVVGGKRRKSRKSKKAHSNRKAHRKSRMNRKASRKTRRSRRH
jgi:hypothetical protein